MAEPFGVDRLSLSPETARRRIADNYASVLADVANAAVAAGREPSSVKVIGVSKYVDAEITSWLVDAGCNDLGENRVQHLKTKADAAADHPSLQDVRWHLIGHLQRNKVRTALPHTSLVHSVDSVRLLEAIASVAAGLEQTIDVLIEVNVSGEADKTGLPESDLPAVMDRVVELQSNHRLRCVGLMAMAGWGTDGSDARRQFAGLRQLADDARDRTSLHLPELSMGMSGDFAAAIAEGSTMVRIGSRLFEGLVG